MSQGSLRIGDWLLEPRLNRLSREGRVETLEPLAAEVLAYLAEHAGEVVSAEKLTETLWPRRFVGDSPVYRIMADLRRILGDDARAPKYIETIRKRGYRLIATVGPGAGADALAGAATAPTSPSPTGIAETPARRGAAMRRYALPGVVAAALAIVGWLAMRTGGELPSAGGAAETLSVAVLPFVDMSPARDSEHIGDGIAEALIHQLAQVPDMRVIARNSSFTFKGTSTDVREIGRALDVETVLEGSVQRERETLRVTAQLVDARTGAHIWSRQFDRTAGDIFAVQDEIALAVLDEVTGAGAGEEPPRPAEATDELDAYDFYLLGRARLLSRATGEARQLFERALEIDPLFALAHTGLAESLLYDARWIYLGMAANPDLVERARASIDRALELDPEQIEALASRILLAHLDRSWALLEEAFAKAVEHGPGYGLTYLYYADALAAWGIEALDRPRFDRALEHYERAQSLDPLNPLVARSLALYYRQIGDRDATMRQAQRVYDLARTDDDLVLALDVLGFVTYELGEPDRGIAFAHLEAAVRGALTPTIVHRIGEGYYHLGDLDRAAEWFNAPLDSADVENLGYKALLALAAGDLAVFEAILDELLTDPPPGMTAEFALDEVIIALAIAGRCDRIVALGEQIADSTYRNAQPGSTVYVAACHLELETGAAGPYEDRLRQHLRRYEAFGTRSRIGLILRSSMAAVLRERENALTSLRDAVDIGFVGLWWLTINVPFDWLADDERFVRVRQETERENAAMLERIYAAEASGNWCALAGIEPKGALIDAAACAVP